MVMLLQWCEDIYRSIYFYHNITGQGKKSLPGRTKRAKLRPLCAQSCAIIVKTQQK